jgi:hypothetical protein
MNDSDPIQKKFSYYWSDLIVLLSQGGFQVNINHSGVQKDREDLRMQVLGGEP